MNRSVLVVNHGGLAIAPRGIEADIRTGSRDIYTDVGHTSPFSLSPPLPKTTGVIPGMQEVFTKFPSPPHPSPILAATLGGYSNHTESCMSEMATTRTTSSCVTTPQSLYSDPINSAEGQSNFESSFEASSSSAIDLVEFPSNLMHNTLDEFDSLDCGAHDEACRAIQGMQAKSCSIQLDDEELDIVPNELVQFVSESTRRIRGAAAGGLSSGDSDLDEIDHDARIASLCLPILQPPSLVSSHLSDGMRPPSLSPQSRDDGPLVAGHSDDITAIEFTRAYLSEPADSHSTLNETKDFETYQSISSMSEFKPDHDADLPQCERDSPEHEDDSLSSLGRTPKEGRYERTTYEQLVLKPSSDSRAADAFFIDQVFPKFSESNSLESDRLSSPSNDSHRIETSLPLNQHASQVMTVFSNTQSLNHDNGFASDVCMGPTNSPNDGPIGLVSTELSASNGSDTPMTDSKVGTSIPVFHNLTALVHTNNNTGPAGGESGSPAVRFSPIAATQPPCEKPPSIANLLLKSSASDTLWNISQPSNGLVSSSCSTIKSENPTLSQVGMHLVPSPVLCQSAPMISSAQSSVSASVLPTGQIPWVTQSSLPTSSGGIFTSAQPSVSLLLTADSSKPSGLSSSVPSAQNTNRAALNYLNLPLQVLQALPNLRPGMSILLNVKNDRSNGQLGAINTIPTGSQPSSNTAVTRTDGTVFLLPGSQIPVNGASKIQPPQIAPVQRTCQLNSSINQSLLFMPSAPSSNAGPMILPTSLSSVASPSTTWTPSGTPSSVPVGTQFLLLRSTAKPELKVAGPTPVSGLTSTSEMTFLISTNLAQKSSAKPSLLLIPTPVSSSSIAQQPCVFPTFTNPLNFQSVGSNLVDVGTMPSFGYRSTDLPNLLGVNNNSTYLQLGVGQPNVAVPNTLLAAALNRSISTGLAASTLSFPIAVLPTNPQTLLMPSSTSIQQPSSSSTNLLPSSLASSLLSIATQASSVVTSNSSISSVNFNPTLNLTMTTQPGHSFTSLPSHSTTPTGLSTPGTMIACVPASKSDLDSSLGTSLFPPKKLVVLPSADNLLSSSSSASSRASLPSGPSSSEACKNSDSKFPRLSSHAPQPLSPCVLSSPAGTLSSSKSASPAPPVSTTGHATCRRRHQCPYCPKSCERKDNLQAHIRTHTGERPYPCRFCPKAFPQKDHLRAHIRTHTGEKPYRCPQCMKAFAQLGNLHRHVKTHKR